MNSLDVFTLFLFNIVIYNIPLLYGTVGEIIIEKSGSLNLGVEGIMAVGAIFGYLIGCSANSLTVGILASFVCAGLFGIIFAVLTVTMQANQNVTGLTMTTFGVGLFFFIGKGLSASWPVMTQYENINNGFKNPIEIPLLSKIPVLGKALFSHNILVYLGIFIAIAVWFYLKKTKAGLRLRAIGENPAAADSLGINITLYKYVHIILGSGIMGIGGYYMGLNLGGSFEGSNCWINGYGWIAVALVIFANWNTLAAILGTLVFGFFNTLQIYSGS
ncbi:MAG: ABC transporter permease, partial [Candidatus Fimenecus sp.]